MAIDIQFNTVITIPNKPKGNEIPRQIDIRCLLETLALRAEYKPVVLAIIGIIETQLTILLTALGLLKLSTEPIVKLAEAGFALAETGFNTAIGEYNEVKSIVGGVPCVAFDDFFKAIDESIDARLVKPYQKAKNKVLSFNKTFDLVVLQITLIENLKEFFAFIKDSINQLPDVAITVGPAARVGLGPQPEKFKFNASDPFKINTFIDTVGKTEQTTGIYKVLAEDIGKKKEKTLRNIAAKIGKSINALQELNPKLKDPGVAISAGDELRTI